MRLLNELWEGLKIAVQALNANKVRSFLTTLGISIGIFAFIFVYSTIQGIDQAFQSSISSLGSDVLYVQKHSWFSREDWIQSRNRKDITLNEYEAIKQYATLAAAVAPTAGTSKTVKFGSRSLSGVSVVGTTEEYLITSNSVPELGRFMTRTEVENRRPVCVIGSEVAERLFRQSNPIGRRILVANQPLRVVGVLEKQGSMLGFNLDTKVIIPYGMFTKVFGSRRWVTIEVKAVSNNMIEQAKDELTGILRRVRKVSAGKPDDFAINQQDMFSNTYQNLTRAAKIVALVVSLMSLVVGGIGVMNIMMVSITERTREIGIRKAIGARKNDILRQFLIEAIMLTGIGGLLGIVGGLLGQNLLASISFIEHTISLSIISIGVAFIIVTGLFFGIYPAYKAARLDPIESLRYE